MKTNDLKYSIGNASSSASTAQSQQAFIFHVQNQQPLTHKAAVYYHQQLALQEDQGNSDAISNFIEFENKFFDLFFSLSLSFYSKELI